MINVFEIRGLKLISMNCITQVYYIWIEFKLILYFFILTGEENWGGQCALGRRQSPIDLAEEASVVGVYPSLSFINYSEPIQNAKVKNTGHSSKF